MRMPSPMPTPSTSDVFSTVCTDSTHVVFIFRHHLLVSAAPGYAAMRSCLSTAACLPQCSSRGAWWDAADTRPQNHETASLTFVMGCWKIFFGWKPPDCCRCCRASLFSWKRVRGEFLTPDCDSRFVCGMCSSSRRGRIYRGEQVKRVSIRVLRMHANPLNVTVVHEVRRESRRCNLPQT